MPLKLLALAFTVFAALLAGSSPAAAGPPNVLFIAADDLRTDLNCYGEASAKTPNLDRLAVDGFLFRRAYCQQALCNPSRASLMTGRRPDTLRIWDLPTHFRQVAPDVVTLPEWFKQHGYFTQNIGKIFHNWRQEIEGDPQSWSVPATLHYATHGSDVAVVDGVLPKDWATTPRTEARDVADEAYFDGRIAALATAAIDELSRQDQPWFLAVGFWKPHLPFNPPKRYWDLYDRDRISLPQNPERPADAPSEAFHDSRELLRSFNKPLTEAQIRELRHGYLAGISYLDAQVGKLLDKLDQEQQTERTVVVFWSDHGFHLGEHDLWCKTSNFERDARVPLIFRVPESVNRDVSRGTRTDALAELLDLYPTLTELCGLPHPDGLEGRSLVPVLQNPKATVKSAAYTQHPRPAYGNDPPKLMGVSVRTARYRYTEWREFATGHVTSRELYDHDTDPHETRNVIADPAADAASAEAARLLEVQFPRRPYR